MFAPLGGVATLAARARRRRPESPVADAPSVAPEPVADPPVVTADVSPEQLPIDGYDHLAASQVVDRLGALTADELATVAAYERGHRHRQSVLAKVAQLQG